MKWNISIEVSHTGDCYRAAKKLEAKQRITSYEKLGLRTIYEPRSLQDWRGCDSGCAVDEVTKRIE